jgi:hypothetical protein
MRRTLASLLLVVACQKSEPAAPVETPPVPHLPAATAPATNPNQISEGLQTPESVLYDADQDVYFISNINGAPDAADGNGFISRVNAETLRSDAKWIESGKSEVILNAPKGMAVIGDDLFVADITTVRVFDRKSGKPKGETMLSGATFLNDIASDGTSIYVSDSGADTVWQITAGTAQKFAEGKHLKNPNGLDVVNGELWVVTQGGTEVYKLAKGKKTSVALLPKSGLDGLAHLADGTLLITSWDQKCVYRGPAKGPFTPFVENVNGPADIGIDTRRNRLLVPHFIDNVVSIHPLQ